MLPSGLPESVANEEDLARFLTSSGQFNTIMVRPAAYLPNPKDRETSVSRHGAEPIARLREIGRIAAGDRKLYGVALCKAGEIRAAQLEVASAEPPERHAVIRGWPWIESDPELQKAKQKELAVMIASAAGQARLL